MKRKIYRAAHLSAFLTGCILLLHACKKADHFYDRLQDVLQLADGSYGYPTTYRYGDTMTVYGRFGALNSPLKIMIGNTPAQIAARSEEGQLQKVRIPITKAFSLGQNAVNLSLNAQSVQGQDIFILETGTAAGFTDTLELKYTGFDYKSIDDFSTDGIKVMQTWTGSGRIFYFRNSAGAQSLHVWKDSLSTTLLNRFSDDLGTFKLVMALSGNADRKEKSFYFSALAQYTSRPGEHAYVLCRIDLANNQLTTLNRTFYPDDDTKFKRSVHLAGPFEGPVGQVRLPPMHQIYPAENGVIYFKSILLNYPDPYVFTDWEAPIELQLGKIDATGKVSYVSGKLYARDPASPYEDFALLAKPFIQFTNSALYGIARVDPDENLLFFDHQETGFSNRMSAYNLTQQREVSTLLPDYPGGSPVTDGPFEAARYMQYGSWMVMGNKVVYLLGNGNQGQIVQIDFGQRKVSTYTPYLSTDLFSASSFVTLPLNYTPDGHLLFGQVPSPSERDPVLAEKGRQGLSVLVSTKIKK